MTTRLMSVLFLSVAITTSACSASMKTPDIKQNPHPTKRYEITLTIKDAPGPFDSVTGFVQYKVSNDKCVPLQPVSGATLAPKHRVSLNLQPTGNHVYKGHFFADLLQDEDYFGMGVCHWGVVAASVDLKIKQADLNASVFNEEILSGAAATSYFLDSDYFGKSSTPFVLGDRDTQNELRNFRTDIFSVTLDAKDEHQ